MGTLFTEHSASSSVKSIASPRTCATINSSSHNKNYAAGFPPISRRLFTHLQRCTVLLFGLFLCVFFIAFALCTAEGSMRLAGKTSLQGRKFLRYRGSALAQETGNGDHLPPPVSEYETALHGLGSVYMKGTRPMPNMIIANIDESCDTLDFRLFLRTLYRSGTMSSADLVFLFPWPSLPQSFSNVLNEEGDNFSKYHNANVNMPAHSGSMESLRDSEEISAERRNGHGMNLNKGRGQTFWGANPSSQEDQEQNNFFDSDYGSVVGFSINDLDPANTFSEFLSSPSSQLRRWLCYEMLLGLLRSKFRLVMLAELGGVFILRDVFVAKAKRKDFLYLTLEDSTWADMDAEFDDVLVRPRSLLGGPQAIVAERRNNFDDKHSRDILRRGSKCKRCSKAKHRNRTLLSRADESQLRDKGKDNIDGDDGTVMKGAPDLMVHAGAQQGLMETVYGTDVWNSLEHLERQQRIVSSRVILSSMRAARGLARCMSVEIVRVAVKRGSQLSFPDHAILSYLIQKSPHLLGRRVVDLYLMENNDSKIHGVKGLKPGDVLLRSHYVQKYSVLHAKSFSVVQRSDASQNQPNESMLTNISASLLILANICTSITNASNFYPDCDQEQLQVAQAMLKS